jgi:signal transduction histidine kinase
MATLSTTKLDRLQAQSLGVEDLRELMEIVNETALSLQSTHEALTQEVGRLKGELAEANRQIVRQRELAALGEMAAGIAHEIRNPLGSIQLYVQMLGDDVAERVEEASLCRKIGVAVQTMDAIVSDVLTFARNIRVRPVEASAEEVFQRALSNVEALIARHDVRIVRVAGTECPIHADPILLMQAIGNVIRNAIEAMVEASITPPVLELRADVRTMRCPDGARAVRHVLTVRDYGPGLPGEVAQRMFNPFYTTRATGTGLGLAIVHRIVVAHGGHVLAGNAGDGGAEISICLPPHVDSDDDADGAVPETIHDARACAASVRDEIVQGDST